jgi:PAS domain S-box-containing protein
VYPAAPAYAAVAGARPAGGAAAPRDPGRAPVPGDRRRGETAERRESARRLAAVVEGMSEAFLSLDAAWRVTYANRAACRLNGLTRGELVGRDHWQQWPETVGCEVERRYRAVAAEGVPARFEHHYPGVDAWHAIQVYPAEDGGLAVFYRDVTAEKRAEAERARLLAEAEVMRREAEAGAARYRSLSEAVPVQVWTARPDGVLDFVSDRTAEYFGGTPDALLGAGWAAFVHPPDVPAAAARWARALAAGTAYEAEFRLRRADGELRWHLARALPTRDAAGAVTGWVGSNTDVEDERRARAEAERANAVKAEFLASMSHELRTPLNAIGGYAELMELGIRGPVTAAQVDDLRRIRASQQHLLGLINSVLNFAKLEAGRVHYDLADVPLGPAVAAVEALVAPQVRARGLAYEFPGCDAALTARADAEKLRQIVLNLLSNAVKFTQPGGRIAVTCEAAGAGAVAVRVADTGVGIAPHQLGQVFDPFVQVGQRGAAHAEGVGLGLAISRDLARGMGGDLTAESTPGVGSTFTLTLPGAVGAAGGR